MGTVTEQTSPTSDPDGATPASPPAPAERPPAPVRVHLRTAPRFGRFALTGALLGLVIGAVFVLLRGSEGLKISTVAAVGYLAVVAGMIGGLLGAGLALLADRRSHQRG